MIKEIIHHEGKAVQVFKQIELMSKYRGHQTLGELAEEIKEIREQSYRDLMQGINQVYWDDGECPDNSLNGSWCELTGNPCPLVAGGRCYLQGDFE
ncbi:MAG: hypothetical protein A2158_01650 [Chloroflexi bacterium RBG_13_46_14]|nr:MAG: hypothetical protein A2158_01650 [Chloroflexi bacterium RBG_13_46_14]